MATAIEYGIIAAAISAATIVVVSTVAPHLKDTAMTAVQVACKQPTPDGKSREIAWVEGKNAGKGGYIICPR